MIWKPTLIISLMAVVSAIITLELIVMRPGYTKVYYNLIIILIMAFVVIRTLSKLRRRKVEKENMSTFKLLISGVSGGAIAALSGLGGASIIIPMLNLWMKVNIKKSKNISYGTIFFTALFLTVLNLYNS